MSQVVDDIQAEAERLAGRVRAALQLIYGPVSSIGQQREVLTAMEIALQELEREASYVSGHGASVALERMAEVLEGKK